MKQKTLTNLAKGLAEELHHEARFEIITEKIERYINLGWMDGFAEGYQQGRSPLTVADEELERFQEEFKKALPDATGTP